MRIIKVTRKRQITLPKDVCEKTGINEGDYVRVYVDENNRIIIEKALSLDRLAGSLNPDYPLKNLAENLDKERKHGKREK
ncbi:MAG: AbrB/MazE/SpoVT family DNA-binding domain-containing protein [Crenarchaeota archaeon]|nr:AbrB/MazE/SpoVT family DNA-binding domain-containing protein [Thermoproteota archaeon]